MDKVEICKYSVTPVLEELALINLENSSLNIAFDYYFKMILLLEIVWHHSNHLKVIIWKLFHCVFFAMRNLQVLVKPMSKYMMGMVGRRGPKSQKLRVL